MMWFQLLLMLLLFRILLPHEHRYHMLLWSLDRCRSNTPGRKSHQPWKGQFYFIISFQAQAEYFLSYSQLLSCLNCFPFRAPALLENVQPEDDRIFLPEIHAALLTGSPSVHHRLRLLNFLHGLQSLHGLHGQHVHGGDLTIQSIGELPLTARSCRWRCCCS